MSKGWQVFFVICALVGVAVLAPCVGWIIQEWISQ